MTSLRNLVMEPEEVSRFGSNTQTPFTALGVLGFRVL